MKKKAVYIEPVNYFSKETRKEFKLGEYAESDEKNKKEEYVVDCGGIQPEPLPIKVKYIEPANYIPEDLRKKYKLGEYAEQPPSEENPTEEKNDNITPSNFQTNSKV